MPLRREKSGLYSCSLVFRISRLSGLFMFHSSGRFSPSMSVCSIVKTIFTSFALTMSSIDYFSTGCSITLYNCYLALHDGKSTVPCMPGKDLEGRPWSFTLPSWMSFETLPLSSFFHFYTTKPILLFYYLFQFFDFYCRFDTVIIQTAKLKQPVTSNSCYILYIYNLV